MGHIKIINTPCFTGPWYDLELIYPDVAGGGISVCLSRLSDTMVMKGQRKADAGAGKASSRK